MILIAIGLLCIGSFQGPFRAREHFRDMRAWAAVVLILAYTVGR